MVVQTTALGCVTAPISQLTVRDLPFITNRASLAGVTMYCPKRPTRQELALKNFLRVQNYLNR